MVITFAHRGARLEEPENTIPAFETALRAGVTGLETDVWLAADGEVVCAHDPVVRKGRRRRRISESSAAELAELSVPRLADVYEQLGTSFELSVDVKSDDAAGALVRGEECGAVVTGHGASGWVVPEAFAVRPADWRGSG